MARRDDQSRQEHRHQAPQRSGQDQEQEGAELETPQPEHSRLQNTVGNAAIAALMGANVSSASVGIEVDGVRATRHAAAEKSAPELGGDDDPVDIDGPLLLEEPRPDRRAKGKRTDDRPAFLEPMPDDVLPPADLAWFARLPSIPVPDLPAAQTLDSLLQPGQDAVRLGLRDWALAALRLTPPTPTWQLLTALLHKDGLGVLQDPHGRVIVARSRVAAIAAVGLSESPVFGTTRSPASAAVVAFCCDLAGRAHRVRTVAAMQQNASPSSLPHAADVFDEHTPSVHGGAATSAPPAATATALHAVISGLCGFEDPLPLVPRLPAPTIIDDDDDPLGIDAAIAAATGGTTDPDAGRFDAALNAAERLAMASATTRIRAAGVAVALAETAHEWTLDAPGAVLYALMTGLDTAIAENLSLLVDVARAAQSRKIPPKGLRNGLRRAARSLRGVQARAVDGLVEIAAGVVPPAPQLRPHPVEDTSQLTDAVAMHDHRAIGEWVSEITSPQERATCDAIAALADPAAPETTTPPAGPASLGAALDIALDVIAGAIAIQRQDAVLAHKIAATLRTRGISRRSGAVLAEGTVLGMEASLLTGDADRLNDLRDRSGAALWRMGANGPLSLLARWAPPEDDED